MVRARLARNGGEINGFEVAAYISLISFQATAMLRPGPTINQPERCLSVLCIIREERVVTSEHQREVYDLNICMYNDCKAVFCRVWKEDLYEYLAYPFRLSCQP
jgi:hypothetical protein